MLFERRIANKLFIHGSLGDRLLLGATNMLWTIGVHTAAQTDGVRGTDGSACKHGVVNPAML
jgi:hypothetical protein